MFGILKFERSIEQRLLDEVEKEYGFLPIVFHDEKHTTRCIEIRRKIYEAYESPPNLITHTAAEVKAYEKEREIAANMPEKLLRRWIGPSPENPFADNDEMKDRFDELLELARMLEKSQSTSDNDSKRLIEVLEELRSFSTDVLEFREYELREQAARTIYAVMKINGYPFRWYAFKRKFIRIFLRLFGYDEIECNTIVEQLIKAMVEEDQKHLNFLKV